MTLLRSSRPGRLSTLPGTRSTPRPLAWILLAILAVSPLPFGSTLPLAWTIWGLLAGLVATISAIAWLRAGKQPSRLGWPGLLGQAGFILGCLYLVVQILPLGNLVGGIPLTISDGTTIVMPTISVAPGDTILMLVRMLTFGLLFILAVRASRNERGRALLLNGIVVITTAHALYGMVSLFQLGDTILGMEKWKYFGVATGTFLNRNTYATYLAIGTALALTMAVRSIVHKRSTGIRLTYDVSSLLYLVAAAIMVTTIVTTNSRAGFAVAIVGIVVVLVSALGSNVRLLRPVLIAMPVLLVLFGAMFLQLGERIWVRFEDAAVDFDFRLELYRQAFELIMRRPLTGFGGGTFELAFTTVHSGTLPNQLTWDEAHNTYIELWADLGLVFGSIPILLAAGLFVLLVMRLVRDQGSWSAQTAACATLAIAAIHSLFDFSLEIQAVAFLFVVVCAIGFAGGTARAVRE